MEENKQEKEAQAVVEARAAAQALRKRFQWREIETPRFWKPKEIGEQLIGYYGGRSLRDGAFGQYEIVVVHVPARGAFTVSGTELLQLIDASLVEKGHPIEITWGGRDDLGEGRTKKRFTLCVAEGKALSEDVLPEVRQ